MKNLTEILRGFIASVQIYNSHGKHFFWEDYQYV